MENKIKKILTILDENPVLLTVVDKTLFNPFIKTKQESNKESPNSEIDITKLNNETLKELMVLINDIVKKLTVQEQSEKESKIKYIQTELIQSLKELTVLAMAKKYNISIEEAITRLEKRSHYNNIIKNNEKYLNIYKQLKEYFEKTIEEKKLDRNNLITRKQHFFHDQNNAADTDGSFHIVFQINKNCNFKCTYCYEGLDKLTDIITMEDIPKVVQGLKKFQEHLKKENRTSKLSFSILGGEPTLVARERTHLLTDLLSKELDLKYIILITNNYDAERTLNFFHPDFPKEKIKIQVSYDGGVIQDNYRKDSKKEGTRDLVKKETLKLLNKGIRVSLKATLPVDAFKDIKSAVLDYIEFEEDININNGHGQNFSYYPTVDNTSFLMLKLRQNYAFKGPNDTSIENLYKDVHNTFEFLLKFELDRLLNGNPAFTRWFREMSYTANNDTCSAGVNLFGLDQNGDTRYCHRTEFNDKFSKNGAGYKKEDQEKLIYGSIFKDSFIKNFDETRDIILNKDNLKQVEKFSYCGDCKTLTCVKCPMVNIAPGRVIDTTSSGNLFIDMQSHGLNLSCELNNIISIYLYMFDDIINK